MNSKINFLSIWNLIISVLTLILFIMCHTPKIPDCGIHEFGDIEDIPFSDSLWKRNFLTADSFKIKSISEQYSSSRSVLKIRERMLCDLISILRTNIYVVLTHLAIRVNFL